jgi:biotin-dependent carboxylase-like uncharacterized protein
MVEVKSTGLLTTIQDLGRFGYRKYGVPLSGAMDLISAKIANALLNNDVHCAVIEATIIGPTLTFSHPTFIVVTGAPCDLTINKKIASLNTVIKINSGDTLSIGKITKGVRSYIAVVGGWQSPVVLNSRSYYAGISKDKLIKTGDELEYLPLKKNIINRTSVNIDSGHINSEIIQVTKGPEYDLLDQHSRHNLIGQTFKISSKSNRMAYKLEHNYKLSAEEIVTSSVQPGTVQMTPSGELVILMRDCQTTGGYARVLQFTESSINQLSQKPAGSALNFALIMDAMS